jgi:hypothetical protein
MTPRSVLWAKASALQDKIAAAAKLAEKTGRWEPWEWAWKEYNKVVAKAKAAA